MFKAHVEPRAAGEWFHCKVLSISSRHFYGLWYGPWKIVVDLLFSITIFFYENNRRYVTCYVIFMVYSSNRPHFL